MLAPEPVCARCQLVTPEDDLRLWTTRERLREFNRIAAEKGRRTAQPLPVASDGSAMEGPAPGAPDLPEAGPAVGYRWITVAHALCSACHTLVQADARRLHDLDRRRALVVALAFLGVAALIWAGFTLFAGNWIAAFWRNGAGAR